MKMIVLIGLALSGAAVAQPPASPPPGISWQQPRAPLPSRPARIRRAEQLPPITPAPPEVEAMLAPEQAAPAADHRSVGPGDRVEGAWQHPYYALDPARYGLPQPQAGARWIAFVDGALLVAADGRVLDTRWNVTDPVAAAAAQDHLGDEASNIIETRTAPALILVETVTTTTSADPDPR